MNSPSPKSELQHCNNPAPLGNNDFAGGRTSRKQAMLLFAALIFAKVGAYAVDPPPPAAPAATPAKPSLARIQFATPVYDFGKVTAGEVVSYTYIFTNVGSETLQIASVTPSCGCTTAGDWSHSVEPGKTGTIPIRFNSPAYAGPVGKTVTVSCNDPSNAVTVLQIKGTLWQPIDVTPRYAMLTATTESPSATTTVRITNNLDQALTVFPPESNNPAFAAELKTNVPGREFEVTLRTVPPLTAGNVSGIISLKTSATNMPTISITAFVNVAAVVTVVPPTINLPTAPLIQVVPITVTIRNTGTNALVLSEPSTSAKGVDVQLKEVEAGHHFTATLTFPAGFEIAPGNQVELRLKSNHPDFASIKVPILQAPRPAPIATPATGQIIRPAVPPATQ